MDWKKVLQPVVAIACLFSAPSWADEAAIRHSLAQFLPGTHIGQIAKTPYKGIYEVVVDGTLAYTNETGQILFVGNLIDLKTRRNVAVDRQEALGREKFKKLPLQDAITIVKGNGKRKFAVFSDPKCPYCHQLENTLKSVNNFTEYIFVYPIESLHPGATVVAKRIWCSANRAAAWTNWMQKNVTPPGATTCPTPLARNQALGNNFDVQGTPTLVFPNGQTIPGTIPAADLEKALSESNR